MECAVLGRRADLSSPRRFWTRYILLPQAFRARYKIYFSAFACGGEIYFILCCHKCSRQDTKYILCPLMEARYKIYFSYAARGQAALAVNARNAGDLDAVCHAYDVESVMLPKRHSAAKTRIETFAYFPRFMKVNAHEMPLKIMYSRLATRAGV